MAVDKNGAAIGGITFKLPFALREGKLIHISEVASGKQPDCKCPGCGEPLVARKGNIVRHHFSHESGGSRCGEGAIHAAAKLLLHQGINKAIQQNRAIGLTWVCKTCLEVHQGQLLKKAVRVVLEAAIDKFRPDIALIDAAGKPVAVIEVIVSHPPEDEAKAFWVGRNIALIEYRIESDFDLENLRDLNTLRVTSVNRCLAPRCNCGGILVPRNRRLYVADVPCWECNRSMKIACGEDRDFSIGPHDFADADVELCRQKGVIFQFKYSRTLHGKYRACVCEHCESFIGRYHLHKYRYALLSGEAIDGGRICTKCKRIVLPVI
ncbi:MAG: competence protein CoiA family protein [Elusimicrobiota bacterium]|jgi:hypothetical protein